MVWALFEHRSTAKLRKQTTSDRLIVLFDEIEAHLHPRWQRLFLPTLIDVLEGEVAVSNRQLIVANHSPLATASMETKFDNDLDRLFVFEMEGAEVSAKEIPWSKKAEYTLQRLHLCDDERIMRQRRAWYQSYQEGGVTLKELSRKAPLIAEAIVKQQQKDG